MIEKLYTVEEVAELASVTGRTIRNYLKSGRLVGRKIGGQWRFPESEVQRLLTGADDFSASNDESVWEESPAGSEILPGPQEQVATAMHPAESLPEPPPVFHHPYVAPAPLPQPSVVSAPEILPTPDVQPIVPAQPFGTSLMAADDLLGKEAESEATISAFSPPPVNVNPAIQAPPPIASASVQASDVLQGSYVPSVPPSPVLPAQADNSGERLQPPTAAPNSQAVAPHAQIHRPDPIAAPPVSAPQHIPTPEPSPISPASATPFSYPAFSAYGTYGSAVPSANYPLPAAPISYPSYPSAPTYYPLLYGQVIPPFPGSYFPSDAASNNVAQPPAPDKHPAHARKEEEHDQPPRLSAENESPAPAGTSSEHTAFQNLSDVGRRVAGFVSEVHDCSYGPLACMVLDRYQTLEAAKHTSEKLSDLSFQESDDDFSCQSYVEYDERFSVARYTLFGSSHFLYQSLQIIG